MPAVPGIAACRLTHASFNSGCLPRLAVLGSIGGSAGAGDDASHRTRRRPVSSSRAPCGSRHERGGGRSATGIVSPPKRASPLGRLHVKPRGLPNTGSGTE